MALSKHRSWRPGFFSGGQWLQPARSALKWPESSILLYLFLAALPCDILSGFLVFCDRVVYPVYLSSPRQFGLTALEDQQCAGALMWTCVTLRLPGRRGNCHGAFAFVPRVARIRNSDHQKRKLPCCGKATCSGWR